MFPKNGKAYFQYFPNNDKFDFDIFEKVGFGTCEGCLRGFTDIKNVKNLRKAFDGIFDDF